MMQILSCKQSLLPLVTPGCRQTLSALHCTALVPMHADSVFRRLGKPREQLK